MFFFPSGSPSLLKGTVLSYIVTTQERRGGSFSQLGLEPNPHRFDSSVYTSLRRVVLKRSDTQTFSNFSNYFNRVLKFPKTFSSFSK